MGAVVREAPECLRQLSEILAARRLETEGIVKEAGAGEHAAREQEYRATFLDLANERVGQGSRLRTARLDRYYELFGIFPTQN